MIKTVRTHRLAENELGEVVLWYEAKQRGLGVSFFTLVDKAIDKLRAGLMASGRVPGVTKATQARRILLRRFPYSIVFMNAMMK